MYRHPACRRQTAPRYLSSYSIASSIPPIALRHTCTHHAFPNPRRGAFLSSAFISVLAPASMHLNFRFDLDVSTTEPRISVSGITGCCVLPHLVHDHMAYRGEGAHQPGIVFVHVFAKMVGERGPVYVVYEARASDAGRVGCCAGRGT